MLSLNLVVIVTSGRDRGREPALSQVTMISGKVPGGKTQATSVCGRCENRAGPVRDWFTTKPVAGLIAATWVITKMLTWSDATGQGWFTSLVACVRGRSDPVPLWVTVLRNASEVSPDHKVLVAHVGCRDESTRRPG